ncbi:MAG TPA: hypothetical protein VLM40_00215, partial [Gemmata sp.]|nr:hypothetical protein [Gemmata sp.]
EIRRGYRIKDLYRSPKTGCQLRWIELRNLQCYLVRPSFLMPYLSGYTEDMQAPFSPQVHRPVLGLDRRLMMDSGVVVRKNPGIVTISLARRSSRRSDLPLHPASETLTDGEHPEPLR